MIDPEMIDQATLDTLLGGIITTYHMSPEDAEDILYDVMVKLVVWYRNNKDTDKYAGGTIRMSIPFIRRAIHNRVLDHRIRWYTQGRQEYRKVLDQLKVDIEAGYAHEGSLEWGLGLESGGMIEPVISEDLQRWMGGLTKAQYTAILGRHVLELSRDGVVDAYPELFDNKIAVSRATASGLAYLRERATAEGETPNDR